MLPATVSSFFTCVIDDAEVRLPFSRALYDTAEGSGGTRECVLCIDAADVPHVYGYEVDTVKTVISNGVGTFTGEVAVAGHTMSKVLYILLKCGYAEPVIVHSLRDNAMAIKAPSRAALGPNSD